LEHCRGLGFNAAWVDAADAGRWDREAAPDGPLLDSRFVQWAKTGGGRGLRIFVVIQPVGDGAGEFRFSRAEDLNRIRRFIRALRRRANVRDFVLSFDGAPLMLEELGDALRFGRVSAAAHLETARVLRRDLSRKERIWFLPAIASTRGLQEQSIPYAVAMGAGLSRLDSRIGIVWNGPEPISPTVGPSDIEALRSVAGERPVLLRDRYPSGLGPDRLPLALALAPLRGRDPRLREELAGYLSVPMVELGGSRLALRTAADYLRDPEHYDADGSWQAAIATLAGEDPAALEALRTQALEWGGWVTERNYRSPLRENPISAAELLRDPAAVALWGWVERRYPERMSKLGKLKDGPFREDLLRVMRRRLAVARAMPVVLDLRAALAAASPETQDLIDRLRLQRSLATPEPSALTALDRFLYAAGVASLVAEEESAAQ
jgi:hypothetical protein